MNKFVLALAAALYLTCFDSRAADRDLKSQQFVQPIVTLSGSSSRIKSEALYVLTSAEGLSAVWSKHLGPVKGDNNSLNVDFSQCTVVAAFFGPCVNVDGIAVTDIRSSAGRALVRVVKEAHQTAGEDMQATTPFVFIVLSGVNQEVLIEEGVRDYLGEPLQWRRFAPKRQ